MDDELREAIETANRLFKERDSAEFWSQNIIDATRHLTKKKNWTKFYAYMANPEAFDPSVELRTIEDAMDKVELSYPDELDLEEVRYGNGPGETIIHVRKKQAVSQDDEKEDFASEV